MPLFAEVCREQKIPAIAASRPATAPLFFGESESADKREFQAAVLHAIEATRPEHVLLVARWGGHDANTITDDNLRRSIRALHEAGATVWILKQVPEQKGAVPRALALARHWGTSATRCCVTLDEYQRSQSHAESTLSALQGEARFIDPTSFFFTDGTLCRVELDGQPLFVDDDHLSPFGALQLRPALSSLITELTMSPVAEPAGDESRIARTQNADN
jgi:hypothetical protein